MHKYKILLFYKYVQLDNPTEIVDAHLDWCLNNDIKGRVFFAKEGVNGSVSGLTKNTEKYKKHLTSFPELNDIWFKEDEADEHAFRKMHVRLKNEIVHGDLQDVSLEHGGKKLSPEELLKFYEDKKDFVIVDARNWYESKIGKFKNAIAPQMKTLENGKKLSIVIYNSIKIKRL